MTFPSDCSQSWCVHSLGLGSKVENSLANMYLLIKQEVMLSHDLDH